MHKVQLSLTSQEVAVLEGYGAQLGYSLPKTLKFIISKTAEWYLEKTSLPTYPMSPATEQKGLDALAEYNAGKTHPFTSVDALLDQV